jgi:FKBP-type peptidyl-prolyl cis-trans isomerase
VLEKNEHGWWLGVVERGGTLVRGYFPKNYVKEKPRIRDAPLPPPRPVSMAKEPAPSTSSSATAAVEQVSNGLQSVNLTEDASRKSSARRGPTFSLRSLNAFDDLMNKGYAVEVSAESANQRALIGVAGQCVEMHCVAMTWDGANTDTHEFCSGVVKFVIGKRDVVPGLEAAAQLIGENQSAVVTCSPKMAYGAAGFPPMVPPNSFVVFNVRVQSVSDPRPDFKVQGPSELLTSGVSSSRAVPVKPQRETQKLMVVPAGGGSS